VNKSGEGVSIKTESQGTFCGMAIDLQKDCWLCTYGSENNTRTAHTYAGEHF
jgi:hypothetical protein